MKQALKSEEEREQALLSLKGSDAAPNSKGEQEGADGKVEGEEEVKAEDEEQKNKKEGVRFRLPPGEQA